MTEDESEKRTEIHRQFIDFHFSHNGLCRLGCGDRVSCYNTAYDIGAMGIGATILTYVAISFIYWETWGVLAWIVGKIADRIERKKEREYFERLNKE